MESSEYTSSFVQGDDSQLLSAIKQRDAACTPLLRTDPMKALQLALVDPPFQTRTVEVKDAACDVVCKALMSVKEADIETVVGALSLDDCDVLMKYIYRGLGQPRKDKQYPVLLKWHPAVLKRTGQASIVRVISEVQRAL
eukprot:CAMPEP_0119318600 /NCGR_PEP_ID=MMETSP1333-20130426/46928_1 /TAXON_ID=418940 /ORGANISM="Scyphosphaera apsteinii, Strain RCC1455" /LENGTH=139 /DNA_ID=CAMNT_0007324819 /DNA_START=38 /DNA_END=457 /DNA_ORIENTATION=+